MPKVSYLKREIVIGGDNKDVKNVGGKIEKIYEKLQDLNGDEINFRRLSFDNFLDFITANGYDKDELSYENLYYDLKYSPLYSNN